MTQQEKLESIKKALDAEWIRLGLNIDQVPTKPVDHGAEKVWYPGGIQLPIDLGGMPYEVGAPQGEVVHYNAGEWRNGRSSVISLFTYLKGEGFGTCATDRDGTMYFGKPVNYRKAHCGSSAWGEFKGSLNEEFDGNEMLCSGRLTPKYDANKVLIGGTGAVGEFIPLKDCRIVKEGEERYPGEWAGLYQKYTAAQERAQMVYGLWKRGRFKGFSALGNTIGHDEARHYAGGPYNRQDPGGSHSKGMIQLRKDLLTIWGKHGLKIEADPMWALDTAVRLDVEKIVGEV